MCPAMNITILDLQLRTIMLKKLRKCHLKLGTWNCSSRKKCDAGIAESRLQINIALQSCRIAIAEVLPSSCRIVITDLKISYACPPMATSPTTILFIGECSCRQEEDLPKGGRSSDLPSFRYWCQSSNCIDRSFLWILTPKQSLPCFKMKIYKRYNHFIALKDTFYVEVLL